MQYPKTPILCIIFVLMILTSCGKLQEGETDQQLNQLIVVNQLNTAFQADLKPTSAAIAELGGLLFFSPDLSIDGSVACVSCHHPSKAGADGIALPIGIGGVDSRNVGKQRIDAARKNLQANVEEGLIPRNSPTVINAALYQKNMFWDGRVRYGFDPETKEKKVEAGFGVAKFNPSNYQQNSLLQTQARMPMTSAFEMKGGLAPYKNDHEIEQSVVQFLQTSERWCSEFSKVFEIAECKESVTLDHITQALAEFQATLIYIDSPFERYILGNKSSLTEQQKRGAINFLQTTAQGGAGCVSCHSGKNFSNESFVSLGIPASGQGANDNGLDFGRNNVDKSVPRYSFRVPSLLNIALTGPYFHNGVANTLEDTIGHHLTDPSVVRNSHQIRIDSIDYEAVSIMIADDFRNNHQSTINILPRNLTKEQVLDLVSFLTALTDPCLTDEVCIKGMIKEIITTPRGENTLLQTELGFKKRTLDKSKIVVPQLTCARNHPVNKNAKFTFSRHGKDVGFNHEREVGLVKKGWLVDVVNYSGLSVVDLDYDCLDDVVFDAGVKGLFYYAQQKEGSFKSKPLPIQFSVGDVTALVMDINGDYKFDLFVGNYGQNPAYFAFDFINTKDIDYLYRPVGPVINASIADFDLDGDMDIAFALWRSFNTLTQEHLWINDGAGNLTPKWNLLELRESSSGLDLGGGEQVKRLRSKVNGAPDMTFTPNFADFDNDGDQDLFLAADFSRSQVLRNDNGNFVDITDKNIINDNNGMGAAVADFDNDGKLDWFVSSINDTRIPIIHGHKLYRNTGDGKFENKQIGDVSEWSWAACAKDFNNDGLQDIFYISGYGEKLKTIKYETEEQKVASERFLSQVSNFSGSMPTMMINDGKGGFINQSASLGLGDVFDGRAIGCFDYEQDGDIDIVVAPLEGSPVLYKNHLDGLNNWLAIRFIGLSGNVEAFGTKVTIFTKNGRQYREVMFENNYISRNPAQLHFGLAEVDKIEKVVIELPKPNKKTIVLDTLGVNQLHVLRVADLLAIP